MERSQVQPNAELTSQVLENAAKIPNTKDHVAQDANINNVVLNKLTNPHKIRNYGFFFLLKNTPKYELEPLWSHFDLYIWLYK